MNDLIFCIALIIGVPMVIIVHAWLSTDPFDRLLDYIIDKWEERKKRK